jgi:hypothetical protein
MHLIRKVLSLVRRMGLHLLSQLQVQIGIASLLPLNWELIQLVARKRHDYRLRLDYHVLNTRHANLEPKLVWISIIITYLRRWYTWLIHNGIHHETWILNS